MGVIHEIKLSLKRAFLKFAQGHYSLSLKALSLQDFVQMGRYRFLKL